MRVVTREEFFAALNADKRDIMPSVDRVPFPYSSTWRDRNRNVFGRTEPTEERESNGLHGTIYKLAQ